MSVHALGGFLDIALLVKDDAFRATARSWRSCTVPAPTTQPASQERVEPAAALAPKARLRALFDSHYDFVWRTVRHLGVSPGGVDDAAQEVFIVASRRLDAIRPGSERAFLHGVARRVAADARDAQSRRAAPPHDDDALVRLADTEQPGADELLDQARAQRILMALLDALPIELREVFVLFEIEGLTMAEIAEAAGLPPGTVASRLRRARELFEQESRRYRARSARGDTPTGDAR